MHSCVFEFYLTFFIIKNHLSFIFNFEMKFIKRQLNMVTHSLIKVTCFWVNHYVLKIAPTCIETFLIDDMK